MPRRLSTLVILSILSSCPAPSQGTALAADPAERRPVLVELFTSEGCSSCPPADEALQRLVSMQPVPGAEIIALELHVDYWNDLGWADPFSNSAYADRQRAYARVFGKRGVYTPQMVVGGQRELVGSRDAAAREAIQAARMTAKARVGLTREGSLIHVTVAGAPGGADVWLAVTEAGLATSVPRGENAGRVLAHAPVVRALVPLGATRANEPFAADWQSAPDPSWKRENLRAVVFAQDPRSLAIAGVGALSLR